MLSEIAVEMTLIQYFSRFWDYNVFKHIAYHANLGRMQQTGKSIETNKKEIEILFSVHMKVAIIKMPQCKMY